MLIFKYLTVLTGSILASMLVILASFYIAVGETPMVCRTGEVAGAVFLVMMGCMMAAAFTGAMDVKKEEDDA